MKTLRLYPVIFSGCMVWASEYFELPKVASVALMIFGLWAVAPAVEIAFKGDLVLINREWARAEYFSAAPCGAFFSRGTAPKDGYIGVRAAWGY